MKLLTMELLLCTLLCQTANIVISNTMLDDSMDDEMLYEVPPVAEEIISIIPEERGSCECGLFHTTTPTEEDIPIITKPTFDVECNIYGEEDCIRLCTVLAEVIKDSVPELLCSAFKDFDHTKAFVHSRICGYANWIFTDYDSPYEFCCKKYTVADCYEQ